MSIFERLYFSFLTLSAVLVLGATTIAFMDSPTPVEQKVVEIHMMRNVATVEESKVVDVVGIIPLTGHGTCSGEFINANGDILTAKHCVEGFDSFEVQTFDRRKYTAVVVATSTAHDLALIHIDRPNTPYFRLADRVERGQRIFVLGSPLAITDTLSTGIIARLDGDMTLMDCSALPGNSGGPVFDSQDRLVGVVSAGFIVLYGTTHLNIAQSLDVVRFFLADVERSRGRR